MDPQTKKRSWIINIESKEHALKVINHVAKVFIILGILQAILSFGFEDFSFEAKVATVISGFIYIALGFLFKKFKKTFIAVTLFFISLVGIVLWSIDVWLWGYIQHRGLPITGMAVAFASLQAIKAARYYEEKKDPQYENRLLI